MLTIADLQKPISHEARAELRYREARIIKLQSALEKIADWLRQKPQSLDIQWALETLERAIKEGE